jgi:hypothetical protein
VLVGENYFKGVEFNTNLIVIDSKGIDVIVGMDWMSKQRPSTTVQRRQWSSQQDGREIEYIAELFITHQGATNQIKLNRLEAEQNQDVQVVDEHPNTFSEELPGMSSDRNI